MNNITKRILTALVAIPLIVLICMAGGIYFFAFISIASALALKEFYGLVSAKGAKPLATLGIISGLCINLAFFHNRFSSFVVGIFDSFGVAIPFPTQAQLFLITTIIIVVVLSLVELFRNNGSAIHNLSTTFMGIFYIPLCFGTFIGLREVFVPFDFPMFRYFSDPNSF